MENKILTKALRTPPTAEGQQLFESATFDSARIPVYFFPKLNSLLRRSKKI